MSERGQNRMMLVGTLLFLFALFSSPAVTAANDPGHDSLYVLRIGDTNVTGSINLTGNLTASFVRFTSKAFGDYLDIVANGTILPVSSRPAVQGDTSDLYLDSIGNVYISTRGGTTGRVQIGPTTGSSVTLNVSGTIRQQNVPVCLSNGTNCISGNNSGNVSSVTAGDGLANSGTDTDPILDVGAGDGISVAADTVAVDTTVCRNDGTNCPAGATAGVGWTNTSGSGNISLTNDNVNVSANTLFIDNTNGRVGVGTSAPNNAFEVIGTINATAIQVGTTAVWYAGNDGAGSGLDADLLDGQESTFFLNRTGFAATNLTSGAIDIARFPVSGTWSLSGGLTISGSTVALPSGTTVNGFDLCLSDGTNCPASALGQSGWLNTSGGGNVSLSNPNVNVSANTLFIDNTNGRVGVGTTRPLADLHVNASESAVELPILNVSAMPMKSDANGKGVYIVAQRGGDSGGDTGGDGGVVTIGSGRGGNASSGSNAGAGGAVMFFSGDGGDGSSGITPGVGGVINIIAGGGGDLTGGIGSGAAGGDINISAGPGGSGSASGSGGDLYLSGGAGSGYVLIPSSSVGIGANTPAATLHVNGNILFNSSTATNSFKVQNTTGSSHIAVTGTTGRVDIGETLFVDGSQVKSQWTNYTTADQARGTTTLADITGLSWWVLANKNYTFDCMIYYNVSAATIGLSLGLEDSISTVSSVVYGAQIEYGSTNVSNHVAIAMGTQFSSPDVQALNTLYTANLHGFIQNGASDTLIAARYARTAGINEAQIRRGSYCIVTEI